MSNHNVKNYPETAKEYLDTFIQYLQSDIARFKEINKGINTSSQHIYTQSKDDDNSQQLTGNVVAILGSNIAETHTYPIKTTDTNKGQMSIPMMLYLFSFMDFVGYLVRKNIIREEKEKGSDTLIFIMLTKDLKPHYSNTENITSYLKEFSDHSKSKQNLCDLIDFFRHGLTHIGFPKNNYTITTNPNEVKLITNEENKLCLNVWVFVTLVEKYFSKVQEYFKENPKEVELNYRFLINDMSGRLKWKKKVYYIITETV